MARGELGPRTAVLAGTITGLGLLTKGFAVVMPFWVLAALVVALRRSGRAGLRPATVAGLAYGATCLVVGGWWWIRNVILYGEPLPSRFGEMLRDRGDSPVDVADFVHRWAYTTTRRFWGAFGWFDVYLPTIAITLATIVCVVALVAFCARRDRVAHTPVGDRLVLVAPFLLLLVTQFSLSFRRYLESGQLPGLQGRYWFPALAALAIAIALGLGNLVRRHIDRLPLAVLAAAGAMQLVAGVTIMRHYWGAPGVDITERIRAAVAWSPLPGELLATGAVVAAVVGIVTTVQVAAMAIGRRGDPGDAADQAVAAT
jgi:small subunit ribosomal protein S36